jgi:hypothetical protein
MHRLDRLRFFLPSGERVTITVSVDRPGVPRGGPERRRAEEIAALLWLHVHDEEPTTTPHE